MKKLIFVAGAMIIAAAVSATVYVNKNTDRNDLFEQNLDALAQLEGVTGIGRMCAYEPLKWCIYFDPYEEYEGVFVSDIVRP